MRTALKALGLPGLILSTPVVALLVSRHIATAYAVVTMPLLPGRGGFYHPGSVEGGYALSPSWATWPVVGWSVALSIVGGAAWVWGWRSQGAAPLAGQRWLTTQSLLAVLLLICLVWSLSIQLSDIPRTDTFTHIRT